LHNKITEKFKEIFKQIEHRLSSKKKYHNNITKFFETNDNVYFTRNGSINSLTIDTLTINLTTTLKYLRLAEVAVAVILS